MLQTKKNIILFAFFFIICLLVANFAFAANDHLKDLNKRSFSPSFNEKLNPQQSYPTSPTQLKTTHPSPSGISGPVIKKGFQDIKETSIKPSYGREKPKKKKREFKTPEFKIDSIVFRYLEVLAIVFAIVYFVRWEMKRIRKKGMKKKNVPRF